MSEDREAKLLEEAFEGNVIGNGREQIVLLGNLVRLKNKRIAELEAERDDWKQQAVVAGLQCEDLLNRIAEL